LELTVYGSCSVAYVYASYAAVYKYPVGFAPGFSEDFVHCFVNLCYGFISVVRV
jgi:hypothetical protein